MYLSGVPITIRASPFTAAHAFMEQTWAALLHLTACYQPGTSVPVIGCQKPLQGAGLAFSWWMALIFSSSSGVIST